MLSSHDGHLVAAYNNYALAQFYLSNYEEAYTAQEKAIEIGKEIYPEYDVDLMNLYTLYSRILYKKEEYQKAYTIVSNLIQGMEKQSISTPYLGIHYVLLADIQIRLNQFGKAIISSKKAWELVKHLPEDHPYYRECWDVFLVALFKRAEYAFENGNYKEALIDFELFNSLTTNDVAIYMAGLCYAYFDEHDKAIQSFNKILELRPDFLNANYYNDVGMSLVKKGEFDKATDAFKKYQNLFPKKGESYRNWALLYALQNQKEKAIENLQKAIDLGYDDMHWLQNEESLEAIRPEPAFQKLLKQLDVQIQNRK